MTTPPRRRAELVKDGVAAAIRWSGLAWLVRNTIGRRRVSIVFYHAPDAAVLEAHLRYMAPRYNFIELDRLVHAIGSGDWSAIPDRSLILTFDDGLRENRQLLELFRRYRVRPTIYLCSQIAGTSRHYWYLEMNGRPKHEKEMLKRLMTDERCKALAESTGWSPTLDYPLEDRQALSREEIEEMRDHVDFASHTRFHPILPMCSDEESREEIVRSRAETEALVGRACRHISYPNGDYTEREIELVREAGYASARSIDVGWNGPRTHRFALKVLGTSDDASVTRLAGELSGMRLLIHWMRGEMRARHATIDRNQAG